MKVDRLVSIIMILLDKKRIGAQELADMFEVSLRTIYRDVDSINRAGIPVLSTPGVGGGFEIMQEYKLDKKVFSTADLSAILMGLSSLSSMIHRYESVDGQQERTTLFEHTENRIARKQAAFLFVCRPLREYNHTNSRTISACSEKQSLVLARILPYTK